MATDLPQQTVYPSRRRELPQWTALKSIKTIFPSKRHRAVDKETGQTSYIERFNRTLRQRISRLERNAKQYVTQLQESTKPVILTGNGEAVLGSQNVIPCQKLFTKTCHH